MPLLRSKQTIAAILVTAIVAGFILETIYFTVNFPVSDDYDTILEPVQRILSARSSYEVLLALFAVHTQHLQVLVRVLASAIFLVSGAVNFQAMMIFGICYLLPLFMFFRKLTSGNCYALLGAAFFLCQPLYCEASLWATTAVPFLWIYPLTLGAFYLWESEKPISASITAFLCAVTFANGILALCLLIISSVRERNIRLLASGLALLFFVSYLNHKNISHAPTYFSHFGDVILYTVRIIGSAFGFFDKVKATIVGVFLLVLSLVLAFGEFSVHRRSPLAMFTMFLLGSALLCGLARQSQGVASAYTTSRYTIISSLIASSSALLLFTKYSSDSKAKIAFIVFLVAAGCSWAYDQWTFLPMMTQRRDLLVDSRQRWELFHDGLPGDPHFKEIHAESERRGIILPSKDYELLVQAPRAIEASAQRKEKQIERSGNCISRVEYRLESREYFHLAGYFYCTDAGRSRGSISLVVESGTRTFIYPVLVRERPDVSYHQSLRSGGSLNKYLKSGYTVTIAKTHLPPDRYKTYLELESPNGNTYRDLGFLRAG